MQTAYVEAVGGFLPVEFPDPDAEVLPGVKWGRVEVFGTPAQWVYLVRARRAANGYIKNKLGSTLLEEIGACLLGGYGIKANVGLAAFENLKAKGAFSGDYVHREVLEQWLKEPMEIGNRKIHYRFASQKARYIEEAINYLSQNDLSSFKDRNLRDALLAIPGVGLKTASWIVRNFLESNDVAILDIHILRAGIIAGLFSPEYRVEKHYHQLEDQFIKFCNGVDIPAAEMDAEIWWQLSQSPSWVHQHFSGKTFMPGRQKSSKSLGAQDRHTNTHQSALIV